MAHFGHRQLSQFASHQQRAFSEADLSRCSISRAWRRQQRSISVSRGRFRKDPVAEVSVGIEPPTCPIFDNLIAKHRCVGEGFAPSLPAIGGQKNGRQRFSPAPVRSLFASDFSISFCFRFTPTWTKHHCPCADTRLPVATDGTRSAAYYQDRFDRTANLTGQSG